MVNPLDQPAVEIPREVVEQALRKARIEYVRLALLQESDPGPEWQSWDEFERLAEALDGGP